MRPTTAYASLLGVSSPGPSASSGHGSPNCDRMLVPTSFRPTRTFRPNGSVRSSPEAPCTDVSTESPYAPRREPRHGSGLQCAYPTGWPTHNSRGSKTLIYPSLPSRPNNGCLPGFTPLFRPHPSSTLGMNEPATKPHGFRSQGAPRWQARARTRAAVCSAGVQRKASRKTAPNATVNEIPLGRRTKHTGRSVVNRRAAPGNSRWSSAGHHLVADPPRRTPRLIDQRLTEPSVTT